MHTQMARQHLNSWTTTSSVMMVGTLVGLPWKTSHPNLPINYRLAQGRRIRTLKHLINDPILLKHYSEVMQEKIQIGFLEKVNMTDKSEAPPLSPQHSVEENSLTSPVRIVYACSEKKHSDYVVLNDCLFSGHIMVPELHRCQCSWDWVRTLSVRT